MGSLIQFLTQIWKGFNALEPSKKLSILIIAAVTFIGVGVMVYWTNKPEYRVLFSNLGADDAANIAARLQEKKVPYQISPSGDSILVPSEKISEIRLELASSGLPQGGGVGFEIFDNKSLGATEFVQQLNYQRALQGELSRTINGLDEIQHSRVHLVIPKKSLFVEDQKKPTASVIVKLKAGRTLRPPQIDGIVHLVASSVEGMNPSDVMVVDNSGKVLSVIQDESKLARMSNSQVEFQRNIEKDLTNRVQSLLEKVVGEGKAIVRVSADLDFRITEKTEEKYDPEEPVVRSMQRQSQKSGSGALTAGGQSTIAPVGGKQPGGSTAAKQGPGSERLDEVVNYEINKVVSKTVMPVGDVKKLSVAVLLDGPYVKNDKGVEEFQPRSKKELTDLEELVKKAAGFDTKRGDQVVITNVPFNKGEFDAGTTGKESWPEKVTAFYPVIKYIVMLAALILLAIFVLQPIIKMILVKGKTTGFTTRESLSAPAGELEGTASPLAIGEKSTVALTETDLVRQMANADTRRFAELLRLWIR
ncbi:MAG TPA: flagellar basal-body MS-ring/collar protein FliF [Syntrophales bacterium]|nr:flagellar basal-body MS-ring/collar protein FliF [Syntrophales bacterium]